MIKFKDILLENSDEFSINCTGDVVVGDIIKFTEGVFGGSFKKPKFIGNREIVAKVINDNYGSLKQQHTFTIEVIESSGEQPLKTGAKTTRKGRNIYRNGTWRRPWNDEENRINIANEKHNRGDTARKIRDKRRENYV